MLSANIFAISFMLISFGRLSYGALAQGPCDKKGQITEKCEMKCEWNGECSESIETKTCGCDGYGEEEYHTYNYKNGKFTNGVGKRKKRSTLKGSLNTCANMSRRCSNCFARSGAGSASASKWKSTGCY